MVKHTANRYLIYQCHQRVNDELNRPPMLSAVESACSALGFASHKKTSPNGLASTLPTSPGWNAAAATQLSLSWRRLPTDLGSPSLRCSDAITKVPRRGRGVDFEQRFKTSRWAEDLLLSALAKRGFVAVRIGLSEVASDGSVPDPVADYKVPDLIVFNPRDVPTRVAERVHRTDFTKIAPGQLAAGTELGDWIRRALVAIEVEFSPYKAAEMSGRHWRPKPAAAIARRERVAAQPSIPVAPNIWIKEEDLDPLLRWQALYRVPILVVHVFDQEAFAVTLESVRTFRSKLSGDRRRDSILQQSSGIFRKIQAYDRQDLQAAGERKPVFVVTPAAAEKVGSITGVIVEAQLGLSASKKYVAHVLFSNGNLVLNDRFVDLLAALPTP